ncbi:4-hydroxybenzoate 3-monooxygenase [Kibdelosporangium phytohabitans]|uniref:4-hydroxybenzoate 3-monooxygenase n=1 Tax=Kibdelosporangium phytohabitans TaxID=860235 RepID=A0A0N7F4X2_9PSEU|nr:4-hydroxybenzoate 3-monooxygenase [Kibdelosporangium phytohabitans]ALG12623.1 4-hydroxybenzoate 3-monooxygenase [Kibdelosporangium phytohabitans]MBE1464266.1 p-hydroxybenzoate 3-monooxygenase [Kibdelosporangium phytohabitans]
MRTQVAIVGAGPAGLLLSHLLWLDGIDSVILEARSREYVEKRVRAGVCEHPTVELLRQVGLADRLDAEGLPHHGITLRFDGEDHRIALTDLTGRSIVVYGQQEIVKDLIAARLKAGAEIHFEVSDVELHELTGDTPRVTYKDADGVVREIQADVIAGCDGFHGISRPSIPDSAMTVYDHVYPFAWLGVLVKAPPAHHELIYANHERGFALHSMRTPDVTRLYLQVDPSDSLDDWPDERIWAELHARLAISGGFALHEGPILERLLSPMRSFVAEPMRHGRLMLAGDSAHIVPPTGAKGMNLAMADVLVLSRALKALLRDNRTDLVESYSDTCLRRVWRAEHFSYFMTSMLHRAHDADPFQHRLQLSQLRYTASSTAAATSLAENYVGLPFP